MNTHTHHTHTSSNINQAHMCDVHAYAMRSLMSSGSLIIAGRPMPTTKKYQQPTNHDQQRMDTFNLSAVHNLSRGPHSKQIKYALHNLEYSLFTPQPDRCHQTVICQNALRTNEREKKKQLYSRGIENGLHTFRANTKCKWNVANQVRTSESEKENKMCLNYKYFMWLLHKKGLNFIRYLEEKEWTNHSILDKYGKRVWCICRMDRKDGQPGCRFYSAGIHKDTIGDCDKNCRNTESQ